MKHPLYFKNNIPIFINKTEADNRADKYEHYHPVVIRNLVLHTGDHIWQKYIFQEIIDFIQDNLNKNQYTILDVGCGIGKITALLAKNHPSKVFFGLDSSFQMINSAYHLWSDPKPIVIDGQDKGFEKYTFTGEKIPNITFIQGSASDLPWEAKKIDGIIASFLLDKLDYPAEVIREFHRVLSSQGSLYVIMPFNMEKRNNWKLLYPESNFLKTFDQAGFTPVIQKKISINEPLDGHNNIIIWDCLALVFQKKDLRQP